MLQSLDNNLIELQQHGLRPFGANRCVYPHGYCLPALDDGPLDKEEGLPLCKVRARHLFVKGPFTVTAAWSGQRIEGLKERSALVS